MPHLLVAASLQHVDEANEIGVRVAVRIGERVAHARQRREVDHISETMLGKERCESLPIADVSLYKLERIEPRQLRTPRLFESRVVVIAHAVEADHGAPILQ